jgi:hypothetical protein
MGVATTMSGLPIVPAPVVPVTIPTTMRFGVGARSAAATAMTSVPTTSVTAAGIAAAGIAGLGATMPQPSTGLATNPGTGLPVGSPDFSLGSSAASGSTDPRDLGNQPAATLPGGTAAQTSTAGQSSPLPAGTNTPSSTAFASSQALQAAREQALQSPIGSPDTAGASSAIAIPPAVTGINENRSITSQTTGEAATDQATPGLPPAPLQDPSLLDPSQLAAGGQPNINGAKGRDRSECMAMWDAATHMSKSEWRKSCRETMTPEHL